MTYDKEQTLGDRIREARTSADISQESLGEKCDVSRSAVSQWEKDETIPTGPNLVMAAITLNVSPEYLVFGSEKLDNVRISSTPIINVPLISWVEAGALTETIDLYEPGDGEEYIEMASNRKTLIALRVSGNSMDQEAPNGSIIIVDYGDKVLVSGKMYVIKTADGDVTFKRYRSDPDRFEPASSHDYATILPQSGWQVVGRVIRVERDV